MRRVPPRNPSPLVSARLIGPALAVVRAAGGDPAALVRTFKLPPSVEADAEVWLSLAAVRAFFDSAANETQDPYFGLHLAERLPRGRFGLIEYSCRSAPTVREAMRRAARYSVLLNPVVKLAFVERRDGAMLEGKVLGEPLCLGRHGNENALALLVMQGRALAGSRCTPQRAWLAHPMPSGIDVAEYARVLGTDRVEFGREANGLEWNADVLDLPLSSADAPLLSILDEQAMRALRERSDADGFLGAVRQAIRERLADGAPTLAKVSRALKASPRTLQRRLEQEGTSFQEVLDAVRHELASIYVADERRPLGETAYLLGYSELRAFLRAYRRWTGTSPTEARRARAREERRDRSSTLA